MLQELLRRVAEGGTHRVSELAQELGIGEDLVKALIHDLTLRGYLRPVVGACCCSCAGCPLANTCAMGSPTQIWALTKKGARVVDRKPGEIQR